MNIFDKVVEIFTKIEKSVAILFTPKSVGLQPVRVEIKSNRNFIK